jgi:hypothetical protein
MLVDYLEEEGIVMQDVNPHKLLKYFKSLTFGNHGAGMLAKNIDGPAEFTKMLRNLQLIASTFHHHFRDAWPTHGVNAPTVDFKIHNRVKPPKKNQDYATDEGYLWNRLKDGGDIEVYAQYSLGHGKTYLRLRIGLCTSVTGDSIKMASPYTYAFAGAFGGSLHNDDENVSRRKKINYDHITKNAEVKTEVVEERMKDLLLELIGALRDDKRISLTTEQRRALTRLNRSLGKGALAA